MSENITSIKNKITFIRIEECTNLSAQEASFLQQRIPEAELAILLGEEPRPQFLQTNGGDFIIILRGINMAKNNEPEDMVSIRLLVHKKHIYVAHKRHVQSVDEVVKLAADFESTADFVKNLVDKLTDKIETHIFKIDEYVDELEESMIDTSHQDLRQKIMQNRRKIIELRRYLLPQREVLNQLARTNNEAFNNKDKHEITDLYQRTYRVCDMLDALRERLTLMQEEITAVINDKMNKNMYTLSIVAAIFLPLGFLTGLLGINVGGMPGVDSNLAFWLVCIASLLVGVGIYAYFKHKKWI